MSELGCPKPETANIIQKDRGNRASYLFVEGIKIQQAFHTLHKRWMNLLIELTWLHLLFEGI